MQFVREAGSCQPDALVWVEDEKFFKDVVGATKAVGEDAAGGSNLHAN